MMKTVIIDGKKYELVPVKGKPEESLLDAYSGAEVKRQRHHPVKVEKAGSTPVSPAIKEAVPKLSDYRERYKKRQIRLDEVTVQPKVLKNLVNPANQLKSMKFKGDSVFFGEGVTQEF